jgi:hypothetical protein
VWTADRASTFPAHADPVARQLWLDLIGFYARKRRELTLRNMPAVRAVIDLYGPVLRRIDRQSDA